MAWLTRDGEVLATLERSASVAPCPADSALLVPAPLLLHTLAQPFALEVAFCDRDLKVLSVIWLRRWRVARPRLRARRLVVARAGAFERWRLSVGDRLEIKGS